MHPSVRTREKEISPLIPIAPSHLAKEVPSNRKPLSRHQPGVKGHIEVLNVNALAVTSSLAPDDFASQPPPPQQLNGGWGNSQGVIPTKCRPKLQKLEPCKDPHELRSSFLTTMHSQDAAIASGRRLALLLIEETAQAG